jgi:uncharacterized membrane protein
VDWEKAFAVGHLLAAICALVVGGTVLLLPKGTPTHRAIATVYALALVLVDVAALLLHRESAFGIFHALAVVSLVTIAIGLAPLLAGKRSPQVIATHAYCMTWSYAGLVAAGSGQLTVTVARDSGPWVVPVVIGIVLVSGGVAIFAREPTTLDRVLAG